jgi:hypothetical protein
VHDARDFPFFGTPVGRAATRLACERRITPSSITLSPLAASVVPVVVMSTMSSAVPAAGAPSVAPALSTIR